MKKVLLTFIFLLLASVANATLYYAPPPDGADCFAASGTGFVAKLNECIIVAPYAAVANPLSPTGFSVSKETTLLTGEIRAKGTFDCSPCYLWVNYSSEVVTPGLWVNKDPLGTNQRHDLVGSSLPVQSSGAWQPLFKAGTNLNFEAGVNTADRYTYALTGTPSVYLEGRNGVHLMCLYVDANPSAVPPNDCEPDGPPAPTSHYIALKCSSCPTGPTSSQFDEANTWNILGNNNTGETGHIIKILRDATFLYWQITFNDSTLTTTSPGNDNNGIFSGNDRIEVLTRHNTSNVDPRSTDSVKFSINFKTTPDRWDANYPGGSSSTAYDATLTASCDVSTTPRKCFIKHRFSGETLVDDEQIRLNWMIENTGVGTLHGYTGSTINSHADDPLITLSSQLISGVDTTAPTVGNPNCNNAVTESGFRCDYTTNEPGTPSVIWGLASAPGTYPNTVTNGTCVGTACSTTISGLVASTNYCVKSRVQDAAGNLGVSAAEDCQTTAAPSANLFASPSGGGNCLTVGTPGTLQQCLALMKPGFVLALADGTYKGSSGMLVPPGGMSGTSAQRMTVRATNDGKVLIDGELARQPVRLGSNNDWWLLEGFDARNQGGSGSGVVQIDGASDNNLVRRVVAYNCAVATNCTVMTINGGINNTFEDVAAFGTGRKIFSISQSGQSNSRLRRIWCGWNKTLATNDPKMCLSLWYNSYGTIYDNPIGTWHEIGGSIVNAYNNGIFGSDHFQATPTVAGSCSNAAIYGGIAYIRGSDTVTSQPSGGEMLGTVWMGQQGHCTRLEHIVSYVEPGTHATIESADLRNLSPSYGGPLGAAASGNFLVRSTFIGGGSAIIGSDWNQSGVEDVGTVGAASNIWNGGGSTGARVCKRYHNGTLTSEPLWPWPMQDRINAALKADGQNPTDYFRGSGNTVTSEMETIFGTIPSECRSS